MNITLPETARVLGIEDESLTAVHNAVVMQVACINAAIDIICGGARDSGPPLLVQLQQAVEGQTKQLADEIERYEEQYARAEAAEAERDRLAARVAELEQGCRDYSTVLSTYRAERDAALLHAAALTTEESTAGPNEIPDREEMLAERVIELESDVTTLRRALTDSLEAAGYTEDPDMDWPRLPGVVAAMRVRVAELEAAAAPVEWREGVPSVADVRAHSEGTWQWHGCYGDKWEPEDTTDHVTIQMIRVIKDKVNVWDRDLESWRVWTPIDGVVIRTRPCVDGTPVPWPVHGAEGVADAE